jgi:hypothetical protein
MKYERHPFNVFPLMSDEEIDELAEDIKLNGLNFLIVLYEGKILDGWNRYLACERAGVEPEFTEYDSDKPLQFSLSMNLHRRHLTISQRAAIAADVANLEHGGQGGHVNASNEALNSVSQQEAADLLHVSRSSVQRATGVRSANPALHQKVRDGEVSLAEATRLASAKKKNKKAGMQITEETTSIKANGEKEQEPTGVIGVLGPCGYEESRVVTDKDRCIIQFKALVKALSEQFNKTKAEIKAYIKEYLA